MLLLLSLLACPTEDLSGDTMAAYSTSVTVTDAEGNALPDATVTYSVDDEEQGACDAMPDGVWACGVEMAGHFVITAEAEGYDAGSVEVDVEQGECHVEAEVVSVALEPSLPVCDDSLVNSIEVTLVDAGGGELVNKAVAWRSAEVDDAPWETCDREDPIWVCGHGKIGTYDVRGDADGHDTAWALVEVGVTDDGCDDPITEQITITLESAVE